MIFRFTKFVFVGKEFFDARQTKFFTLLRTYKLRIDFHSGFRYSGSDWQESISGFDCIFPYRIERPSKGVCLIRVAQGDFFKKMIFF